MTVYADGRRLGRTPLEVELDAGEHEIRLVNRARYLDVTKRWTVRADRVLRRNISFGMSTLNIRAPRGSRLYIDGRAAGRAPLRALKISEGKHRIVAKKGRRRFKDTIDVPSSRTVDVRVRF